MATNFKITKAESKKDNDTNYVVKKDFQKEMEKVSAINKELKEHEKMPMDSAHPIPRLRHK
jgi:hypothetical protein